MRSTGGSQEGLRAQDDLLSPQISDRCQPKRMGMAGGLTHQQDTVPPLLVTCDVWPGEHPPPPCGVQRKPPRDLSLGGRRRCRGVFRV